MTLSESQGNEDPVRFNAVFTDGSYLKSSDDVRVAGIKVGAIDAIRVRQDRSVLVTFHVDQARPLPDDVQAVIRYRNLLGDRYLELKDGPTASGRMLAEDATIPVTQTSPAVDLDTLVGGFKPLFAALNPEQVNQLSAELISVLQGESGSVNQLLGSVASLTATLADRENLIDSVINNLDTGLAGADANRGQLDQLIVQLQQLVTGLAGQRHPIGEAVTHLNQLSGQAENLIGDVRPDLKHDLSDLGTVSKGFNDLRPTIDKNFADIADSVHRLGSVFVYGDFLDAYACGVRVKVTGPGGKPVYSPWVESDGPRCNAGGGPR
jgi:phospholipid/cholesterol/gamma-HCH transport system substrate-binding protein